MPATVASHSKPVNIRIKDEVRQLIDRAAQSQGKSRSDFMVDASRRAAEEALLDRTLLLVNDADLARFLNILDMPPDPEKLAKLMNAKPVWQA